MELFFLEKSGCFLFGFLFLVVIVVALFLWSATVVPENCIGLVETFGKYSHNATAGLHFIVPGVQRMRKISLALQPLSIPKYSVITKDNADVYVSLTLNYVVSNAQKYFYGNTNSEESLVQLVRGHLRDIVGRMTLDDALGNTSSINKDLFEAVDDLTARFGVHIVRLNIDELDPSDEIQQAMDQQLTADRRKRAEIAKAEGDSQSINLTNEAQNKALMNTAKAKAFAKKQAADAEAYRIDRINKALAQSGQQYFMNQSLNVFGTLANSDTNLVVMDKDSMAKLGDLPAAKQLLGLNPVSGGNRHQSSVNSHYQDRLNQDQRTNYGNDRPEDHDGILGN